MIASLALLIPLPSAEITASQADLRARLFTAAIAARFPKEDPPSKQPFSPGAWSSPPSLLRYKSRLWPVPVWSIENWRSSCWIDGQDGIVRGFEYRISAPAKSPRPDRDGSVRLRLAGLANYYARLAGNPYDVQIISVDFQEMEFRPRYDLSLTHRMGNVSFPRFPGVSMSIDAETGGLLSMTIWKPVPPPKELKPAITADQATASAVRHAFSDRRHLAKKHRLFNMRPPAGVEVVAGPELSVWRPDPEEGEDGGAALTPEMVELGRRGETILTYWVMLADAESFRPALGTHASRYAANVDAQTGRVLCFVQYRPVSGGGPSTAKAPPPPRIPAHLSAGDLQVLIGNRFLPVKRAGWQSVPPRRLASAKPVVLKIGRTFWRGAYESEGNLLLTWGKVPRALSPNAVLRSALRE